MKSNEGQTAATRQGGATGGGLGDLAVRFVLFMGLWLLLSGHYDVMHIGFGLVSVITVLIINRPVWRSPVEVDVDEDRWEFARTYVHWGRLILYLFWGRLPDAACANTSSSSA